MLPNLRAHDGEEREPGTRHLFSRGLSRVACAVQSLHLGSAAKSLSRNGEGQGSAHSVRRPGRMVIPASYDFARSRGLPTTLHAREHGGLAAHEMSTGSPVCSGRPSNRATMIRLCVHVCPICDGGPDHKVWLNRDAEMSPRSSCPKCGHPELVPFGRTVPISDDASKTKELG